jgi:hypothetical protein
VDGVDDPVKGEKKKETARLRSLRFWNPWNVRGFEEKQASAGTSEHFIVVDSS